MLDYGTLTLLFQDSVSICPTQAYILNLLWQVGGLEVRNPHTGTFIPATPIVGPL